MCLTLVFLAMRAVMDVGGFCAEGGPYVIETHCPEGVPLVLIGGIFGLFGFGGLMAWKGSIVGEPYGALVLLAWPALFLSLGWNFVEYALNPPPGEGIVWGWLIPGVLFVLMGGVPLIALLPLSNSGRVGDARARLSTGLAPRPRPSPVMDAERAAMATVMSELLGQKAAEGQDEPSADLVSRLDRLAALRQSGDLTSSEFEQAKRALLAEGRAT
ncbi:MAG: SHOCT domain-containing protein [Chloroflexota bacterium]